MHPIVNILFTVLVSIFVYHNTYADSNTEAHVPESVMKRSQAKDQLLKVDSVSLEIAREWPSGDYLASVDYYNTGANQGSGESINWEEGKVPITCNIYLIEKKNKESVKGKLLFEKSKSLVHSNDSLRFSILQKHRSEHDLAVTECIIKVRTGLSVREATTFPLQR